MTTSEDLPVSAKGKRLNMPERSFQVEISLQYLFQI
jgi:hypothetical protein